MIPLRDNIPAATTPIINYLIIGLCTVVFLFQAGESDDPREPGLIERYGMIPARITHPGEPIELLIGFTQKTTREGIPLVDQNGQPVGEPVYRQAVPSAVAPLLTLLTCIFLHGGWLHFLGNMWFLWIFGNNVEDRFGHMVYLGFYLLGGIGASLSHYVTDMNSTIPTLGASGAIAAVMGAYMLFYPKARVLTLIPIFIFIQLLWLPAPLFLGIWFVIQLVQGVGQISLAATTGVAWWAHIGGFAFGAAVAWFTHKIHVDRPPVERLRPGSDRTVYYQGTPYRVPRRFD